MEGGPNSPLISESPIFHVTGVDEVTSGTLGTSLLPRLRGCRCRARCTGLCVPQGSRPGMWRLLRPLDSSPLVLASQPLTLAATSWGAFLREQETPGVRFVGGPGKSTELTSGQALGAGPCLSTHGWVTRASPGLWASPPLKNGSGNAFSPFLESLFAL